MSVLDFNAARYAAAKNASQVTTRDTLAEALRRCDAGEWDVSSIIIVGLSVDPADDGTSIVLMHGGSAGTNERLGMLARSSDLMLRNMTGDHG